MAPRDPQSGESKCEHPAWATDGQAPLSCTSCGVPWPGHQLPKPAHRSEGYGELADQPTWHSRVDAMIKGLRE